jgi:hypothetical protein
LHPEINLYKLRFDSSNSEIESQVKYLEISNIFKSTDNYYLIFVADNTLEIKIENQINFIKVNEIPIKITTSFFNEAISFIPCFRYEEGQDFIIFTSKNFHYHVDKGG